MSVFTSIARRAVTGFAKNVASKSANSEIITTAITSGIKGYARYRAITGTAMIVAGAIGEYVNKREGKSNKSSDISKKQARQASREAAIKKELTRGKDKSKSKKNIKSTEGSGRNAIAKFDRGFKDGFNEGYDKGFADGKEEGYEEGYEDARTEFLESKLGKSANATTATNSAIAGMDTGDKPIRPIKWGKETIAWRKGGKLPARFQPKKSGIVFRAGLPNSTWKGTLHGGAA